MNRSLADCLWNGSVPCEWRFIMVAIVIIVLLAILTAQYTCLKNVNHWVVFLPLLIWMGLLVILDGFHWLFLSLGIIVFVYIILALVVASASSLQRTRKNC
jgi:hypothetical protein